MGDESQLEITISNQLSFVKHPIAEEVQDAQRAAEDRHVRDEQAKATQSKEDQLADEQKKALDALYAPVLKCLKDSYVQPEDCTPKFADLVRGRLEMAQRSTPGKVIDGSIRKYHVDKDGSSATVEALVKYTSRNGETKEELITYYLELFSIW